MANENLNSQQERNDEDRYLGAEVERRKAELRPSKLHGMPLVAYVEQDGTLVPVYRKEE